MSIPYWEDILGHSMGHFSFRGHICMQGTQRGPFFIQGLIGGSVFFIKGTKCGKMFYSCQMLDIFLISYTLWGIFFRCKLCGILVFRGKVWGKFLCRQYRRGQFYLRGHIVEHISIQKHSKQHLFYSGCTVWSNF